MDLSILVVVMMVLGRAWGRDDELRIAQSPQESLRRAV